MFRRDAPEVKGLGVMTLTPGLIRSAQLVMCLGFPGRTPKATTESVTMPLVGPESQVGATRPALTRRVTSGASEKLTTSAGWPAATARLCVPEGPNDVVKLTPLPPGVCS